MLKKLRNKFLSPVLYQLALLSEKVDRISDPVNNRQNTAIGLPEDNDKIMITGFNEYDQMIEEIKKVHRGESEETNDRILLNKYCLDFDEFVALFGSSPSDCDPFSREYTDWEMAFFSFLSGAGYDTKSEGLSNEDIAVHDNEPPTIYWDIDTRLLYMKTYTEFLDKCRPAMGMTVLELGCGWGNLLELFGRCGCHVTGIDASEGHADYTRNLLNALNIDNDIICGSFYDIENVDREFDIIVFESAFHHTGEPMRLMNILADKLKENGRIYFLNEVFNDSYDRPWGIVRYDGESVFQIRYRGWLELGFRLDFFIELLGRTGLKLSNTYSMPNSTELYEVVKNK